eukprot:13036718-Alexandrium_andersonii.AAC.1
MTTAGSQSAEQFTAAFRSLHLSWESPKCTAIDAERCLRYCPNVLGARFGHFWALLGAFGRFRVLSGFGRSPKLPSI